MVNGATPFIAGWFACGKYALFFRWMITRGIAILGNRHIFPDFEMCSECEECSTPTGGNRRKRQKYRDFFPA